MAIPMLTRLTSETKRQNSFYIDLNKHIGELERDWKELLEFVDAEGDDFNGVNYATMMS